MRTRYQLLSIFFLFTLFLGACGGSPQSPSTVIVPPTTTPTTPPQLVVDVYEPNSTLVMPPIQIHGGLGTHYIITFVIHATDATAGIKSITEQTSESLSGRILESNATCTGKASQPDFGAPTLYSNLNAVPGNSALTDVLTEYKLDLAIDAHSWDTLDGTISITAVNGHNQSATFTGAIHWDQTAPC